MLFLARAFLLSSNGISSSALRPSRCLARMSLGSAPSVGTLFDVPVSNNGARCRMVLYYKQISTSEIAVVSPAELGGLKSEAYLKANPQGKMPLLVLADGHPVPESDTISRYLCSRFAAQGPALTPADPLTAARSDAICRLHDIYLAPVQTAMYKVAGIGGPFPPFGQFGSRAAALQEIVRQLKVLESYADEQGPYLVGAEPALADCSIWPSAIFWKHMLPKFEGVDATSLFGPKLQRWCKHMAEVDPVGITIHKEIATALADWDAKDRWAPILGAGVRDSAPRTLFDKIIAKEIPSQIVYEDEHCLAFRDISPAAPTHLLVIPKRRDGLTQLRFATAEHAQILSHLLLVAQHVAKEQGLDDGFRVVINDGPQSCQTVFHLHLHVLGGRQMGWPPG